MPKLLPFLIAIALFITSCTTSEQNPNIILIMTDDQGWFDVGFNGNTDIKTPHLDALAKKGIIFDRFYAASAVCSPTRASLITGRNPLRMNIPYANAGHMKKEEITIAEMLQEDGYTTGHFGKWHLGTFTKTVLDANRGGRDKHQKNYSIPSEHGYDTFFCTESKVPTFDPMISPDTFSEGESLRYGWKAVENSKATKPYGTAYWKGENQNETDNLIGSNSRIIMDRVIPFIDHSTKKNKSFFTTIWFHTPHLPVVSDSSHRNIYENKNIADQLYYGAITAMDEQIGRLWKTLEDTGQDENTIIFFCSDNGPEVRTPGSAGIFKARKRSLYEGGVRVPAFVVWKKALAGGKRIDFPAVTSDYMPTILDILNIDYPDERPIDGVSLFDALKSDAAERSKAIGFICKPQISWVTNRYKLIGDENLGNLELYDLIIDPSEKENLIEELPKLAYQLKADLMSWLTSVESSKKGLDYN